MLCVDVDPLIEFYYGSKSADLLFHVWIRGLWPVNGPL